MDYSTLIQPAVTGIVVGCLLFIQSWMQARKTDKDKEDLKNEVDTAAKKVRLQTKKATDKIYQTINGQGLLGVIKNIQETYNSYEVVVNNRFEDMQRRINAIESLIKGSSSDSFHE